MNQILNPQLMEQAAYSLKAISQGTRLCVISLLAETEELSVSQMVEQLNMPVPLIPLVVQFLRIY